MQEPDDSFVYYFNSYMRKLVIFLIALSVITCLKLDLDQLTKDGF